MKLKRQAGSLSGLPSLLIALGGVCQTGFLKTCEKYEVSSNKWARLPALNTARYLPGSILLETKRAFCFCGGQGDHRFSSIESIQSNKEEGWKALPLNESIAKTYSLAAAEYRNEILVFGGSQ